MNENNGQGQTMAIPNHSYEKQLQEDVEELRARFKRTQDLYREVCVLLFFRYGVIPTVNKLYQLVRKGSMSAPTEALNSFWRTLRERSRVTIEHADLPDDLRVAAGSMVAALWESAQTMSREALTVMQAEAVAEVNAAASREAQALAARATALESVDDARKQLGDVENLVGQLRQDLAAAAATKAALDAQVEDLRRQLKAMEVRLDQSNAEHAAERERLAERTQLAEHRFAEMEKRALLEMDRERTATAKAQKSLDAERATHVAARERLHDELNVAQEKNGQLRQEVSSLQSAVDTLGKERDREREELLSLREQLTVAIRQAAADKARADQLEHELRRITTVSKARAKRTIQPSAREKKVISKPAKGDDV